ncbi:metallophosphoesterase family protein [Antarcticimicrobium sediminis]|uniref:metallophosphoesterase family protein n=1 Tax=Antarcticimicrobium sediminis TaxID=2546227 RepID=UPI0014045E07|nr:DNA repair exonuclease [Antarcticimicrobium sediminis]
MPLIRLLHTADIHLDSPLRSLALRNEDLRTTVEAATRAAFSRLIDFAMSEQVTALLIAGDLFDGKQRSARTAAFLTGQLDRLRAAEIRVFYIKGNHDAENPITGSLDLPDNVHVFDARGGKVQLSAELWIHGVSFADRHAPESLLPRFPEPVAGAVNIAMLHTSLAGAAGHDTYAPCHIADLVGMGFDYWALGHIHKRQVHSESPWIVMPGMPQGRDIGEAGPKSASLLTIENGTITVEEVPTSVVDFTQTALDVTEADSDDALRSLLRAHLEAVCAGITAQTAVLRLTLTGQSPRYWQILRDQDVWQETIADLAQMAGRLWIDKLVFDLAAPEARTGAVSATDELSRTMLDIASESGFNAVARAKIDTVLQDLPAALRARLIPDEAAAEALTHELAQSGAYRVLARMKGAES